MTAALVLILFMALACIGFVWLICAEIRDQRMRDRSMAIDAAWREATREHRESVRAAFFREA